MSSADFSEPMESTEHLDGGTTSEPPLIEPYPLDSRISRPGHLGGIEAVALPLKYRRLASGAVVDCKGGWGQSGWKALR
jgi:hypothetical protein